MEINEQINAITGPNSPLYDIQAIAALEKRKSLYIQQYKDATK